jgi:hypothetical protein
MAIDDVPNNINEFSPKWSSVKRGSAGKYQTSEINDIEDPTQSRAGTKPIIIMRDLHTINQ